MLDLLDSFVTKSSQSVSPTKEFHSNLSAQKKRLGRGHRRQRIGREPWGKQKKKKRKMCRYVSDTHEGFDWETAEGKTLYICPIYERKPQLAELSQTKVKLVHHPVSDSTEKLFFLLFSQQSLDYSFNSELRVVIKLSYLRNAEVIIPLLTAPSSGWLLIWGNYNTIQL